ncbi:amidohydrolase [Oceanobacillus neutriphilus]|uniref:Amidohydrolase n=1 Tax=Oceanobacillus neutriphilus TaxID=531815 RepID=A0ABQ2NXR2_9BACI|nr:amidohydrolase [Oceanobacillus neutriphilus]GGP13213.1 amidohydrolase [Oceanobacillus neutriphilus]
MFVITGATIWNGKEEIFEHTNLFIRNGKIEKISEVLDASDTYRTIDGKGYIITPGLIDVHTHLGVSEEGVGQEGADFNETSDPVTPEVRAIDGINPREEGLKTARKSGITTVQVMPGSANVIGGEMSVLKTTGHIVDEMIIRQTSGMKAATGENPKRFHGSKGKMPATRMGVAAVLRKKLLEAKAYTEEENPKCDLGLEQLAKVINKEIPLRVHAHRADDIITVLRLKREFDIDVTIEHCTEGHFIADYIAKHDVMVSVGPTMSSRSKVELKDKSWSTIKALMDAGISCSITTDHPVVGIEYLLTSAIHAVKNGLTEQQALKAMTSNAARHLGVADRVGSLEAGKDADFLLWEGNPFDPQSNLCHVYINGEEITD